MESPVLVLLAFTLGVLLCLAGCVLRFRSSSSSSRPSPESSQSSSSDDPETLREEWRSFKRQMEGEWDGWHQRLRSLLGRVAKQQARDKAEAPEEEVPEGAPTDGVSPAMLFGRPRRGRGP